MLQRWPTRAHLRCSSPRPAQPRPQATLGWVAGCAWTDVVCDLVPTLYAKPTLHVALQNLAVTLALTAGCVLWLCLVGGGDGAISKAAPSQRGLSSRMISGDLGRSRPRTAPSQRGLSSRARWPSSSDGDGCPLSPPPPHPTPSPLCGLEALSRRGRSSSCATRSSPLAGSSTSRWSRWSLEARERSARCELASGTLLTPLAARRRGGAARGAAGRLLRLCGGGSLLGTFLEPSWNLPAGASSVSAMAGRFLARDGQGATLAVLLFAPAMTVLFAPRRGDAPPPLPPLTLVGCAQVLFFLVKARLLLDIS